ncbi:interleukin-4 receptor subunit alpha [Anolis carolinensis]|uniref:interleukin-4 receptor subunit alpha n=1 Tax=Anolis carolinensis TaxID=28377 RepID=UPI002F2B1D09
MASTSPGPLSLFLLLFHTASSSTLAPFCHTDFLTALACSWEAPPSSDCDDFRLLLTQKHHRENQTCVPAREDGRCRCLFPRKEFRLVKFHLKLEQRDGPRWKSAWETVQHAENIVKPRPMVNLMVTKQDLSFRLSWQWDYPKDSPLVTATAYFWVSYWPKGQPEKAINTTVQKPTYDIFADRLQPASDYVASVQVKLEYWGDLWSDWSQPCEWHNDFESGEELWKLVLWSCIPIVAMILTCYLCFARVKRDWWDRIPSPAKSKMAESMATFPPGKRIPCKEKTLLPGPSKGNGKGPQSVPPVLHEVDPGPKPKAFLMPEVAVVESPLMVCSRVAETKTEGLLKEEQEEEELIPPHQDAVAGLFRDLLDGGFGSGEARVLELPAPEEKGAQRGFPLEASPGSGFQDSANAGAMGSLTGPGHPVEQSCAPLGSPFPPQGPGNGRICPWLEGPAALGYRSISSLVPQMSANSSHEEEEEEEEEEEGRVAEDLGPHSSLARQCGPLPGLQSAFPADLSALWLPTAALEPSKERDPDHLTWEAPAGKAEDPPCPATSLLSGYRSFTSALQDSSPAQDGSALALLPGPYQPLMALLRRSHPGPIEESHATGPTQPWA